MPGDPPLMVGGHPLMVGRRHLGVGGLLWMAGGLPSIGLLLENRFKMKPMDLPLVSLVLPKWWTFMKVVACAAGAHWRAMRALDPTHRVVQAHRGGLN